MSSANLVYRLKSKLIDFDARFGRIPAVVRQSIQSRPGDTAATSAQAFVKDVVMPQLSREEVLAVLALATQELPLRYLAHDLVAECAALVSLESQPKALPAMREAVAHAPTLPAVHRGLIIRTEPLDRILIGKKTWEMRSRPVRQFGFVALIRKSSGRVYAVADLANCFGPLSREQMLASESKHGISPSRLDEPEIAKYRFAYELRDVRVLSEPVPYVHAGGVVFVRLDASATAAIARSVWTPASSSAV